MAIEFQKAIVNKVGKSSEVLQEVFLEIDHPCKRALNYPLMSGIVNEGDTVIVNTTACTLNLGTGGYHYIIANYRGEKQDLINIGHGMKLKYTPNQINVLFAEETAGPLHKEFQSKLNLDGKPIFVGELHSMLTPICAHLKYRTHGKMKVACIITDHGALPAWMSKSINLLKNKGLLDKVITIGNAFGGDYECVNIYTALQLASNILDMEAIVITMGPGIMGTGTPFGFSGLELGLYLDLCYAKGGDVFYAPRISFKDLRDRHYGISHHFLNIFRDIVQNPIPIILPIMRSKKMQLAFKQLRHWDLIDKHPIHLRDGKDIAKSLLKFQLEPRTMGRNITEDPEFFYGLGAMIEFYFSKLPTILL